MLRAAIGRPYGATYPDFRLASVYQIPPGLSRGEREPGGFCGFASRLQQSFLVSSQSLCFFHTKSAPKDVRLFLNR